jgi:LPS-assembly protein
MSFVLRHSIFGNLYTILLLGTLLLAGPALAQEDSLASTDAEPQLPKGINIDFDKLTHTEQDGYLFSGPVTITWRESRIQADSIALRQQRYVEAEGNVLVVWGGNRIFGSRMNYDLELERGIIENAFGQLETDYIFWAKRAEKIGSEQVRVETATVTTCTQPVPYWSFSVSSATIRVNHYARMWNVRMRARKMPLLYIPFLLWPVKEHRAAGLLMPEIHTTQTRGRAISQELFIPLGRSADLTLMGRHYSEAGFGGGGEFRFVPNSRGSGSFYGFYIDDKVDDAGRYRVSYNQTQQFQNGFRMVADINLLSDFDYSSDFERALDLVSSPTILARLEFSRNGPWTSMNVRELRREQLLRFVQDPSGATEDYVPEILIQQTLPEIEWRGRSRKLGKTPFYLSYESSMASIQQREKLPAGTERRPINADYLRGDLFPTISLPLSLTSWLDITPSVDYRVTYYTQSQFETTTAGGQEERQILDQSIWRRRWGAGLDIIGPKFFKIYDRPGSKFSKRYKHTIEPRISYGYSRAFDRDDEIVLYDEVDRATASGNLMTYALVQRLFAKRPRSRQLPAATGMETIVLADGSTSEAGAGAPYADGQTSPVKDAGSGDVPEETVEIATLEFRQSRSFDDDLRSIDLNGDGVTDLQSRYSDLQLIGRFNPSPATSLDLRSRYDVLYDSIADVTLSGNIRKKLARLRLSVVHRNGLGDLGVDDTQLRLTTGFSLFRGKLQLDIDGSFDYDPPEGQRHIPDKQWRVQYSTQCCTFTLERLSRNFATLSDRQDFYFRIDFRGVGKLLDLHY